MKAWRVYTDEGSTVVFAESRGKAKAAALRTDCCEDWPFTDIRVYRFPEVDREFDGREEMD